MILGACTTQAEPPAVCEPAFQPRRGPADTSGAVLLQEIHLERGLHCIDCHQLSDSRGDGDLYVRNPSDASCLGCHGPVVPPP